MEFAWYTSVAGIVAATILIVQVIKRFAGNVSYIGAIPTWVIAAVVAGSLSAAANAWWHTLPGPVWEVVMQAVMLAAMASGFKEWLDPAKANFTKPMWASDTAAKARGEMR